MRYRINLHHYWICNLAQLANHAFEIHPISWRAQKMHSAIGSEHSGWWGGVVYTNVVIIEMHCCYQEWERSAEQANEP